MVSTKIGNLSIPLKSFKKPKIAVQNGVSSKDVNVVNKVLSEKKLSFKNRLVFVSPSKEELLEDASNEGCNI